ncbi:MAG: hypothetical protein P8Y07_08150 [Gemmatimonadales bacterium]|jgi:hypothetical protein
MKLDVKALALACGICWGALLLLVSLGDMIWPEYGEAILQIAESIYPGYHGPTGAGAAVIVTLYGLVDGAIGGFIFGWLYNALVARRVATNAAA